MRTRLAVAALLALTLVGTACGGGDDDAASPGGEATEEAGSEELLGVFRIDPGQCNDTGGVTEGSYFRMIVVDGEIGEGPYMSNSDTPCGDKTYSALLPGDVGLMTGTYQTELDPPFDDKGNGVTTSITQPTKFHGTDFANSTNEKDPQTGDTTTPPRIVVTDGNLSGDLSAFAASWNQQHFNQGSPKPGGEMAGLTSGPTGTYDESTGTYVLEWTSQIVGGPFNNFTGVWHLEGTFEPEG